MKAFERRLEKMIFRYALENGRGPTKILAWDDAYNRIASDWQNVVVRRDGPKIVWKGLEVLRVDAPGDDMILVGNSEIFVSEDW